MNTTSNNTTTPTDVTVIGLGAMGTAIADLLLRAGRSVTLWNRSPDKAAALVQHGAGLAATPVEAIAASPVTLVCVLDPPAFAAILDKPGAAEAVRGRLVVNLGTSGPADTRDAQAWMHGHGAAFLDGAIQAAPSQMGRPDTPLFVAGAPAAFAQAEPLLRILAGHLLNLGEKIDAAAFMDLATLSYVYGAYAGFLHGARIAEVTGIDAAAYGRLVNVIAPSFGAFFEHQGGVIASGDFRIAESPLRISVPAVRRILDTSRQLGINTELPALVDGWLGRAVERGFEGEEVAALIKVLRG